MVLSPMSSSGAHMPMGYTRQNTFHCPSTAGSQGLGTHKPAEHPRVSQSAPDLGGGSPSGSFHDSFREERSCTFAPLERKNNLILRSQYTVSNLLAFTGPGQVNDKEQFKKEVLQTRVRLRTISRRTINPRSRFLRTWDSITVLALLFTAFVTPFEVSFFVEVLDDGGFESAPINFVCNRLVDAIFILDMGVHFFLPYRASHAEGGMMVYDNKRIAKAYLKGWFAIDFVTCIPLDLIVMSAMDATGESGSVDYTSFRLLRMLRIMKLARIVRASRIINRWQDHISISFATLSLVKFTFLTVVLAHWLACTWGFVGEPHDDEWDSFDQGLTWRQKARIGDSAGPFGLYGASLYVAFNNIFGGSSEIHPANYVEFYVQVGMMVLGSSVWAYVIGSACGIVATLDPVHSRWPWPWLWPWP